MITQILISVIAFIIALGILVTVHEFGHFWVARKLGVKVLRFSIGFGKPIFRYRRDNDPTEYVLAAIPLGGYVKMLDEREGRVAPEERHLAFNRKSVWARIAVVAAGPIANFLLAILLYILVFNLGMSGIKPVVGDIEQGSPAAQANFQYNDRILAVEGTQVRTWQEARLEVLDAILEQDTIEFSVLTENNTELQRRVSLGGEKLLKDQGDIIAKLGLQAWQPLIAPVIGRVLEGGAAEKYGLLPGDKVLAVDGRGVTLWTEWAEHVRKNPLTEIKLQVLRDEREFETIIVPNSRELEDGATIGFVGASVEYPEDAFAKVQTQVHYSFLESIPKGISKAWDMTVLTFQMIGELLVGNASPRNVSGPITIAEYAGKSASIELSYYIDFIAIISISLAVLNILPIPLLDGGHLLYYFIEILTGNPVSEKVQIVGQNIGIFVLACLISLAFYNDITRLLQ